MKSKIISVILTVFAMVTILTSCGSKTECDFCGEEKKCTTKAVFGEEISVCKDCIGELN